MTTAGAFRKTTQTLMPAKSESTPDGQYNPYPAHSLGPGVIASGFDAIAGRLPEVGSVVIDGFPGVLWDHFESQLAGALAARGVQAHIQRVESALLPPEVLEERLAPYLGGSDPLFGFRYPGSLRDFYDPTALANIQPDPGAPLNILIGPGAALTTWTGPLVYVDVPKNEIQFRARSKSIKNLGAAAPLEPKAAYKRSYFVDWVAASRHKEACLARIDWMVDEQRPDQPMIMPGQVLRHTLTHLARSFFRVRPWFEPGPWGGQWIKKQVPRLSQDVPNYAWSFELIVPENGLVFESDGNLLEVSFDLLMFQEAPEVLGECAPNFGVEFPIRYDFLDTFDGGNLSVQCHPRPDYIRKHFGETFTQDECYYILDCSAGAKVYLGFQEGIDPQAFKNDLLDSAETGQAVDINKYVQSVPVEKHDFLLIPNGTIHGAGRNNLVLEISATPYIFTFKMYDWLRMDLDGKPRSLNIERAFENLYFNRQGRRIPAEFVSKPSVIAAGSDWQVLHLPTHANHFYDVHRFEFSSTVESETTNSCHVMSLVEGTRVLIETETGDRASFNYAETFVISAGAGRYKLISPNGERLMVVKTFVKPRSQWAEGVVPDEQPGR